MAKYTETLGEYLNNGNDLPTIFSSITDFADLFTLNYIEREIGFETEELFTLKLEGRANIVIPFYKDKIDNLTATLTRITNPTRKTTAKGTGTINLAKTGTATTQKDIADSGVDTVGNQGQATNGATESKTYELPINDQNATATGKATTAAITNSSQNTETTTYGHKVDDDTTLTNNLNDLTTRNTTDETSITGLTVQDNIAIQKIYDSIRNYKYEALEEFNDLFMGVF